VEFFRHARAERSNGIDDLHPISFIKGILMINQPRLTKKGEKLLPPPE